MVFMTVWRGNWQTVRRMAFFACCDFLLSYLVTLMGWYYT